MQTLILLHGAIGSASQLQSVKIELEKKFEVHCLEFSGHGSTPFQAEFSIAQFANELENAFIKWGDCPVFGYSMGGYVALYHALHYGRKNHPVFTLGTKFKWDPDIAAKESKMLNPEKIAEKIPAFAQLLEARHPAYGWKKVLESTAEMMLRMGEKNPLSMDDFKSISNPCRISIGDRDEMVTLSETLEVYQSLPHSSLIVFPETKHPIEKVNTQRILMEAELFFLSR
ncbi:MAG: alpha/beta fold hydrolase [Flavobacteriales bacterium]|nr:alpha/beta fold hydrolase [Flavobacteriales bacterium]